MSTPDQPAGPHGPGDQPHGSQPGQGWGPAPQPGASGQPGQSGPPQQSGQSWGPPEQRGPDQSGGQPWGQPGQAQGQPWGQGQDQPWGQNQGQPSQSWGQPGQGQPGQPGQPWGQPGQGQQGQPWGAQPGSSAAQGQPWTGQQAFGQLDPKKSGPRKWLAIAGAAVVGLLLVGGLAAGFGSGLPDVGDCVQRGTEVETVDCDSDEAQYRVVGIDEDHDDLTQSEFYSDDSTCSQFSGITQQAWIGDLDDADAEGDVYCLGDI